MSQAKKTKRIDEICREFDARVIDVGLPVARLELATALAETEFAVAENTSNPFCLVGVATLDFYRISPVSKEPVAMGYVFPDTYTKKQLCEIIIKWYSGEEVELLI